MQRTEISKQAIRLSYLEQAKLTQLHAWLSVDLRDGDAADHLSGLQSEEFEIEICGSEELATWATSLDASHSLLRQASFDDTWYASETAHALFGSAIMAVPDAPGSYLKVRVGFLFESDPALLPPFSKIEITIEGEAEAPCATADLFKSRLLSTNHRWHTLVENPDRTPEPFQALMGERFRMEYGHGSVNSYDEFCNWVYGSASSINASRHDMESVSWRCLPNGEYEAVFVLDWLGLNREDKVMAAKTKHTWTMSDAPSDPYPRIQHMDVQFLEPFSIIE